MTSVKRLARLLALAAVLPAAGCLETLSSRGKAESEPAATAATPPFEFKLPFGSTPSTPKPATDTSVAYVEGKGYIRGSAAALVGIDKPMRGGAGSNAAVEPCREAVQGEAVKAGAVEVEVVSAGPHQTLPGGRLRGTIDVRILYPSPGGLEVRRSRLTCTVDSKGTLLEAVPAEG